jgi:hypothetical protein
MEEPAIVERVRDLVKRRVSRFENGGPHTATFLIYNTLNHCFLRIDDRWAIITFRSPYVQRTGDAEWDAMTQQRADESLMFNAIGVTSRVKEYPSGFVYGNCQAFSEAMRGLGFINQSEQDEFNAWTERERAERTLEQAQAHVRELLEKR